MAEITQEISSLGSVPTTADPATFDARADTFLGTALPTLRTQINTWAGQANALGVDVTAKSGVATTKAVEAAASAVQALAAAAAAAAASNAEEWVSGTNYPAGTVVWSPINFLPYRRKTTGGGTTDPSADPTNWEIQVAENSIVRITRSSDVPIVVGNKTNLLDYTTGTFNQTFPAVSTLPEGWFCWMRSTDANVTFVMNGADTISKPVIGPGQIYLLISNGVDAIEVVDYTEKQSFTSTAVILESGTFTAVRSGPHRFLVAGAGGSGGVAWTGHAAATGGAGGGWAEKTIHCRAGTEYTIVVGAGGAAVVRTTTGNTDGNAGGSTTVSGFGVDITCTGGEGGQALANTAGDFTVSGADGGTATGGDINNTGGGSGYARKRNTGRALTGGGNINPNGLAPELIRSGFVDLNSSMGNIAVGGGSGVGGKSRDLTVTGDAQAAGGGAGTAAQTVSPFNFGSGSVVSTSRFTSRGGASNSSQALFQQGVTGNGGCGTGGRVNGNSVGGGNDYFAVASGAADVSGITGFSAAGTLGAGSGAAYGASSGTTTAQKGGDGFVIVEY